MSTTEPLPIDPAELARIAGRLWAESDPTAPQVPTVPVPTGPPAASAPAAADSAPLAVPVAPRGQAPDGTAVAAPAHTAASIPGNPVGAVPVAPWPTLPDPVIAALGPGSAPYTVPVAPRGQAPVAPSPLPVLPVLPELGELAPLELAPLVDYTAPTGPSLSTPPAPTAAVPQLVVADLFEAPVLAEPAGRDVFDVDAIRADFPILSEMVNGHPLIWFDNAATTQKPRQVIDRLTYFYEHENSNIHRAAHELAARATDAYEDAREVTRGFLGAARTEEIVFVRGTTEGVNLVAQTWGRRNLQPGDEIVITHLEHHANIVPWQIVARQTGARLVVAPVDDNGDLLLGELAALVGPRTKLVSATQVANATGTVSPVDEITRIGHAAGARVLIDGAQSVPHLPVDLQTLGADFFVFSGHKILGPTGIGAVYIAERVWDETPQWHGGGNMIADVTIERSIYQGPPAKWEAGTGNIADAVGLAAALRYVQDTGIERIAAYEHELLEYATPRLAGIDGVRLIGNPGTVPVRDRASVLSFLLDGHDPVEVGAALNERGIAVRAGHHCAQPILRRLGVEATVRPSFAFYNTRAEIDVFLDAVKQVARQM